MLDLAGIDVEEIADALADQTDYEHRWLLDPRTGQVTFWTSDSAAGRRLTQSLEGRGPFRRFKNQLYEHHPELISPWRELRDVRGQRRAVEWLLDQGLIHDTAAQQFASAHPDLGLP